MNAEDAEDLDDIYLNAKDAEKKEEQQRQLAAARAWLVASSSRHLGAFVPQPPTSRFRQVLLRVMIVQVISLAVLWWLQVRYGR